MTADVKVSGVGRAEPGPLWSALAAADAGWHVFPCAPGSKRPALRENWQDLATTDSGRIRAWWARRPYNIGIACGQSGLVVIDLDVARHADDGFRGLDGPASGADALERLCLAHGQRYPAGTYTVDTPSGGSHLYFTALAAFREETRRVAEASVGTRNHTLNRAAFSLGQLVAAGLIPPLPVMTGLAGAAARAGLPADEARRTIRSGMAAGARKPRPSPV